MNRKERRALAKKLKLKKEMKDLVICSGSLTSELLGIDHMTHPAAKPYQLLSEDDRAEMEKWHGGPEGFREKIASFEADGFEEFEIWVCVRCGTVCAMEQIKEGVMATMETE